MPAGGAPTGGKRRRWVVWTAQVVLFIATVSSAIFAWLSLQHDQHKWPYDDYLREAVLSLEVDDIVEGKDADVKIDDGGERAPSGYTIWVAGQDEAGDWYPLSQAYWDNDADAYTATIFDGQVPNPEEMRLHPVIANAQGQASLVDYQQRGDKEVGLDTLPDGAAPADQ
jgi:hypothetical protein